MKIQVNLYRLLLLTFLFVYHKNSFCQNTGIDVLQPTEKLHVGGNIKADTLKPGAIKISPNAGAGKVLTSDASGNGVWKTTSTEAANGNIGFGYWGDCAAKATISDYQPFTNDTLIGTGFGNGVSVSGNYAIVGEKIANVGSNIQQGAANIFYFNGSTWTKLQKLTDASGAASDEFGSSVSISGNYAIVGAPKDDVGANVNQGSASIYRLNGSNWIFMQKLTDATGAADDAFGYSVAISGNYATVGAYTDDVGSNFNQGSVSMYQFNGTSWVLMQKITDAAGKANELFGTSVAIGGNYAAVTASFGNVGTNNQQGYANIYQLSGGAWVFMQKVTDPEGVPGEYFGSSISVSGNTIVVGAANRKIGSNLNQGSAFVFEYDGNTWISAQRLLDVDGQDGDQSGSSVFVSGNYILVGAPWDVIGNSASRGSVTIYQRVGLGWSKLQFVTDPAVGNFVFGQGVAVDSTNKRFVIGVNGKAIFGKIN